MVDDEARIMTEAQVMDEMIDWLASGDHVLRGTELAEKILIWIQAAGRGRQYTQLKREYEVAREADIEVEDLRRIKELLRQELQAGGLLSTPPAPAPGPDRPTITVHFQWVESDPYGDSGYEWADSLEISPKWFDDGQRSAIERLLDECSIRLNNVAWRPVRRETPCDAR